MVLGEAGSSLLPPLLILDIVYDGKQPDQGHADQSLAAAWAQWGKLSKYELEL